MPRSINPGMSEERYKEIELDHSLKLTKEELENGWFFCCAWDHMLINKLWKEATVCTCCCMRYIDAKD